MSDATVPRRDPWAFSGAATSAGVLLITGALVLVVATYAPEFEGLDPWSESSAVLATRLVEAVWPAVVGAALVFSSGRRRPERWCAAASAGLVAWIAWEVCQLWIAYDQRDDFSVLGLDPDVGFWLEVTAFLLVLLGAIVAVASAPPASALGWNRTPDPVLLVGGLAAAGLLLAAAVSDTYTASDGIGTVHAGRLIGGDAMATGPFVLYHAVVAVVLVAAAWARPRAAVAVGVVGSTWPLLAAAVGVFLVEGDLGGVELEITYEAGQWLRVAGLVVVFGTALVTVSTGDADDGPDPAGGGVPVDGP